jgi:hypothetical protein
MLLDGTTILIHGSTGPRIQAVLSLLANFHSFVVCFLLDPFELMCLILHSLSLFFLKCR